MVSITHLIDGLSFKLWCGELVNQYELAVLIDRLVFLQFGEPRSSELSLYGLEEFSFSFIWLIGPEPEVLLFFCQDRKY